MKNKLMYLLYSIIGTWLFLLVTYELWCFAKMIEVNN